MVPLLKLNLCIPESNLQGNFDSDTHKFFIKLQTLYPGMTSCLDLFSLYIIFTAS